MIRILSGDYVPTDYVIIENILSIGLKSVREAYCLGRCDSCPFERVCHSVQSAIHYCHKKQEWKKKWTASILSLEQGRWNHFHRPSEDLDLKKISRLASRTAGELQ